MEDLKYCWNCKETKPKSAFHINHHNKDGVQSRCKKCQAKYTNLHYAKTSKKEGSFYFRRDATNNPRRTRNPHHSTLKSLFELKQPEIDLESLQIALNNIIKEE